MQVDKGHYGEVDLSGVRFACIVWWPGPVHDGKGKCQPVVDSSATDAQRESILKIMSGEDTDPGKTIFNVFAATYDEVFDPVFAPIDFQVDIDSRKGHIRVDGLIDTKGEPIKNPITGDEHRARIDIPDGFEYRLAEVGSASSVTLGNIQLNLQNSYGQFANIHLNNHGVVHA